MEFTVDRFSVGLPGLFGKVILLFFNPVNLADDCHSNSGVCHGFGRSEAYAAFWW
jgi:hypothetical protein